MNLKPEKCPHCGQRVSPITRLREKLKLNQMEFANKFGVPHQSAVSRWESGELEPKGEIRDEIVDLCRKHLGMK